MKILLTKSRSLGDSIVMSPAIRELKLAFPNAQIDLITSISGFNIYRYNPYIRKLFVYRKKPFWSKWIDFFSLLIKVKKERYDLALCFYASFTECLLVRIAGIPKRVVYRHEINKPNTFGNIPIIAKKELKSVIERDLDVIRSIGVEPKSKKTEVFVSNKEEEAALNFLNKIKKDDSLIVALAPIAGEPSKCWPINNLIEVIKFLKFKKTIPVMVIDPKDKNIKEFSRKFDIHIMCEKDILTVASFLQKCQLFIGCDSGPKHIAVAMNCPTITLIKEKYFVEWHPYDLEKHKVINLDELTTDKVIKLIKEQLNL